MSDLALERLAREIDEVVRSLPAGLRRDEHHLTIAVGRLRAWREQILAASRARTSDEWRVVAFCTLTLRGEVACGARREAFRSTSFQARASARWPRVGERVDVTFTRSGGLLSVHSVDP